ncbi:MAG: M20/M25/M40 family metallo-hydrolase [Bacteroidota bacterium]
MWAKATHFLLFIVLFLVAAPQSSAQYPASKPTLYPDTLPRMPRGDAGYARILAEAIRIPTISFTDSNKVDHAQFQRLHTLLEREFPRVHASMKKMIIARSSLLFEWPGLDPKLPPVLFTAHTDVVPVEAETRSAWEQPPFSGNIADGILWGRGALDDKHRVITLLAAAEALLQTGFRPQATVYFAFGHDEEIGGWNGAANISKHLQQLGVEFGFVMDEGLSVITNAVEGVENPIALIGVAEKGHFLMELSVEGTGGHAAAPPAETAVSILSRAVDRLYENPFKPRLLPLVKENLLRLSPYLEKKVGFALRNEWLFRKKILKTLSSDPLTYASARTVFSATTFDAGIKTNVLPKVAHAGFDIRILQGETVEDVIEHVKTTIDDPRIKIGYLEPPRDPSPVSDWNSEAFKLLEQTILTHFKEAVCSPALMIAATDSYHYTALSPNIFRFVPLEMGRADTERIHGVGERIQIAKLGKMVEFYTDYISQL